MQQTWNASFEASPINTDKVGDGNEAFQYERIAIRERLNSEHEWDPAAVSPQARHGVHRQGSAVCWFQSSKPTNLPGGAQLGSSDIGRIWINSDSKVPYVWNGSDFALFRAGDFVDNSVLNKALAQVPAYSVKGNSGNAAANVSDLTADQIKTILRQGTDTGVIPKMNVPLLAGVSPTAAGLILLALAAFSSASPKMDGTAAAGSSNVPSREDHVHPRDTSKIDTAVISDDGAMSAQSASLLPTQRAARYFTLANRIIIVATSQPSANALGVALSSGDAGLLWVNPSTADVKMWTGSTFVGLSLSGTAQTAKWA